MAMAARPEQAVKPVAPPPPHIDPHGKFEGLPRFTKECNSEIETWGTTRDTWASVIIPAIGTRHALDLITRMACWLAKDANATSAALQELLEDAQEIKTASLQNRAAIDFLLLVNGHGCGDFEGMCCLNFSDHSKSIHDHINEIHGLINQIYSAQVTSTSFDDFMGLSFKGFSLPLKRFLFYGFIILISILLILLLVPCLFGCLQRLLAHTASAFFLQNKKGGDVGEGNTRLEEEDDYRGWLGMDFQGVEPSAPPEDCFMEITEV